MGRLDVLMVRRTLVTCSVTMLVTGWETKIKNWKTRSFTKDSLFSLHQGPACLSSFRAQVEDNLGKDDRVAQNQPVPHSRAPERPRPSGCSKHLCVSAQSSDSQGRVRVAFASPGVPVVVRPQQPRQENR